MDIFENLQTIFSETAQFYLSFENHLFTSMILLYTFLASWKVILWWELLPNFQCVVHSCGLPRTIWERWSDDLEWGRTRPGLFIWTGSLTASEVGLTDCVMSRIGRIHFQKDSYFEDWTYPVFCFSNDKFY